MRLKDKSRGEQFDIWRKRLRFAKEVHKEKVLDWADKVFDEYSGDFNSNLDTGERYTQIAQVVQSVEQTIQPHLFFQNPKVTAYAKTPEWEKRESLVAAVVNQEYTDIKPTGHRIELENELVILDARLLPFGCTKTTYQVEGDILKEPAPQNMFDKITGFVTGRPQEMIETPVIEKEIGQITERINPLNVYLDYSAQHITKGRFVIEKMHVSKEDLEKPRYEQDKLKDAKPTAQLTPNLNLRNKDEEGKLLNDPDFKGYAIYEIEDLENRVIHTLMDGVDDFIEFNKPMDLPEGSRYAFLWFITRPNQVYPIPPIKFYRTRAKEFSYIYSSISEQIDKFLPKIGFNANQLDKPSQEKWKLGSLGTLVGWNGPPQWDVLQPKVQDDLFKYMSMIKELMNLEAGINDYEVAIPEERKATEAKIIEQGTRARRFAPQKQVKAFLLNQCHAIWQTLAVNADEERFVKILGEDEALEWWEDPETGKNTWTKEAIAGDYWFDFEMESISPKNEQERMARNALNMETVLRPELKQGLLEEGSQLLLSNIFDKFAKENMGIKDRSKIMKKLDGLEPGDEHTLWMTGQYPPISEREQKDPQFLMKHFQEHKVFIDSPAFPALPPELQQGALEHLGAYPPLIQKAMAAQQPQGQTPKRPVMPAMEEQSVGVA